MTIENRSTSRYGVLIARLRASSTTGKFREEMLIEYGKLLGLGAPQQLVDAILQWNDLMSEAAAALESLPSEIGTSAEDAKDAARYRWLRNKDIEKSPFPRNGCFVGQINKPGGMDAALTQEDADKAIDAERALNPAAAWPFPKAPK